MRRLSGRNRFDGRFLFVFLVGQFRSGVVLTLYVHHLRALVAGGDGIASVVTVFKFVHVHVHVL